MPRKKKHISSPFDELMVLINEHGVEKILITLEDAVFIKASNEYLKENEQTAKRLKRIAKRIRKIKIR